MADSEESDDEGSSAFSQGIFDHALKEYPQLEPFQRALADIVHYAVYKTHVQTRSFMMNRAVDELTSFYDVTKKRRDLSKKQLRSIKRNPGLIHRNAVTAVEEFTLNVLSQLAELDPDEDGIPTERGHA